MKFAAPVFLTAITIVFFGFVQFVQIAHAGTLSCTVTTSCPSGTVIFRMSDTTNAHAELPSEANYSQLVCCSGVSGLGTSCSGIYAAVLKLSDTTNAHVEENTETNYANSACISVPSGGVTVAYQNSNCTGYDTTLASISDTTNAHVGNESEYTRKVCATASATQSLSVTISDESIGFGTVGPSNSRFATSDTTGSATEVEAHTIATSTNGTNGYSILVRGAAPTSGGNTIDAIGGTNTSPTPGTEQFGLRLTASGGSGSATAPYADSGFAYDADGTTTSQIASASTGDGVTTTYSMRYVLNVAGNTPSLSYLTALSFLITANY